MLIVFAALWLPYAFLVHRFWFVTDDAFITFRYARNLAHGHGPRFNPGEHVPVEGYSNFLWMLLCAAFEVLGLDMVQWANLASFACGSTLLLAVLATARYRLRLGWPATVIAGFVFSCYPPVAVYSTSGLATMAFSLLLFTSFEAVVLRPQPKWSTAGAILLGLSLLRVEGVFWASCVLVVGAVSRGGRIKLPALGKAAAVLLSGFGAYWLWRWSYYGLPFPNTVYAKVGFSVPVLWRGVEYVIWNWMSLGMPLLIVLAAPLAWSRSTRAVAVPAMAMFAAVHVYSVLVGGDFMAMGRFLLPSWAFAAVVSALAMEACIEASRNQWWRLVPLALIGGGGGRSPSW